jgi:hypothetical protein
MLRQEVGFSGTDGLQRGDGREEMACLGRRAGVLAEMMKGGYEH